MILSEVEFLFFLPVVLVLHWLLPRRAVWQNAFLLLASYAFYVTWDVRLLPLLLAVTVLDYMVGLRLGALAAADSAAARERRSWLAVSLAVNLGTLAFFKYSGFFAESLNGLFENLGLRPSLPVVRMLLPLGLSYYTLQKLGYIIDVYQGRREPCRSLLQFALFTAFFPQLIAGPISRADGLMPQLAAARFLDPSRLRSGAATFLAGFAQKAYVADYLGRYLVDPAFRDPSTLSVAGHWLGLVGYAGQVFCDFAGYSLMAIGCARLFAIELPTNFTTPYLSRSMFEFWRRWHITLNNWLFERIYTPLATSRGFFRGRLDVALMLTFLASGLWHGATAGFAVWGIVQGVGLVVARRWDEFYRGLCRRDRSWVAVRRGFAYQATAWAVTQVFFVLTLVPFRAPSFEAALSYGKGLFASAGSAMPMLLSVKNATNLTFCIAFLLVYHLVLTDPGRSTRERFLALPGPVRGFAYGVGVVLLSLLMPAGAGAFIYGQF
jgi:alginate O-acetyltransferase complex protein AlgI